MTDLITGGTDGAPDQSATPDDPPYRGGLRITATLVALLTIVAAGLVLGAGVGGGMGGGVGGGTDEVGDRSTASMVEISPEGVLDLDTVDDAIAAQYRHVAEHTDIYDHVRCYCGCETAFAHQSLTECFLRGDGAWEAHGAGCGICMGEAAVVTDHLEAGMLLPEIVDDIDRRFGPLTPTA